MFDNIEKEYKKIYYNSYSEVFYWISVAITFIPSYSLIKINSWWILFPITITVIINILHLLYEDYIIYVIKNKKNIKYMDFKKKKSSNSFHNEFINQLKKIGITTHEDYIKIIDYYKNNTPRKTESKNLINIIALILSLIALIGTFYDDENNCFNKTKIVTVLGTSTSLIIISIIGLFLLKQLFSSFYKKNTLYNNIYKTLIEILITKKDLL